MPVSCNRPRSCLSSIASSFEAETNIDDPSSAVPPRQTYAVSNCHTATYTSGGHLGCFFGFFFETPTATQIASVLLIVNDDDCAIIMSDNDCAIIMSDQDCAMIVSDHECARRASSA